MIGNRTTGLVRQAFIMAVGRRIGAAFLRIAATVLLCGFLSALLVRFSPGFGLEEEQLDPRLSAETKAAIRQSHAGEQNPVGFYVTYIRRTLTGDFGFSRSLNRPIRELLAERAPETAGLMAGGLAGAWLLALLLTIPPITWRLPGLAVLATILSGLLASLPTAGVALLLLRFGGPAPCIMALILFPRLYQYLRNLLRQTHDMPHVLLAKAKGLSSRRILIWHVLAPTRGQLLALAAVSINMAFGAAVAVEAICDKPGLGQLAWKSALARDLPVLVSLTMIIALITRVSSLTADAYSPVPRRQP